MPVYEPPVDGVLRWQPQRMKAGLRGHTAASWGLSRPPEAARALASAPSTSSDPPTVITSGVRLPLHPCRLSCLPLPLVKTLVITLLPIWIIQENLFLKSAY